LYTTNTYVIIFVINNPALKDGVLNPLANKIIQKGVAQCACELDLYYIQGGIL